MVEAHATASFRTAREWHLQVLLHGITTSPVRLSDPNATVSVVAGAHEDDFQLVIGRE